MQCCVPFCNNTSTTEKKGITYHGFPSDTYLRAAWLRALGKQNTYQPDPGVVCSLHFLDDDFYEAEGCVRQIRSDAVPSSVQICMMCLDTDSKLVPMSKHQLEEVYQLLTGQTLCETANLQQTLCVLCAQRLIHFRTFRHMSLRAHSLIMDLVQKYQFITMQHTNMIKQATKQFKCNLVSTTLGPDHCDLYIYQCDEDQQPELEDMIEDVAAVVKDEEACAVQKNKQILDIKTEVTNSEPKKAVLEENQHLKSYTGQKSQCARKQNLLVHMSIHTDEKPFSCDICDFKCTGINELTNHKLTHGVKKPYSCEICDYKCKQKRDLISHVSVHTGEKPYSCNICNFKCIQKSSLTRHMRLHTGDKPYSCEICDYKCVQKSDLIGHMSLHTGKKPYSCNICSYKCRLKCSLTRHIKLHSGEKPYSCESCDYKCIQKSSLTIHMRLHTGEKPYSCENCDYKCTQKSDLNRHMKLHTGEKPYSCKICDFKCIQKCNLSRHMILHTGKKPYFCNICNFKCIHKRSLTIHMRLHTGEKP